MVASELRAILAPAYLPCGGFAGACKVMRHDTTCGLYPRGYAGATASVADIALVLVIAEPGEPSGTAKPQPIGTPNELVDRLAAHVGVAFGTGHGAFHKNVRYLLDRCWPGMTFDEQMRRTWITEGVMCSANVTTGPVPRAVENECANRYLKRQLELLLDAFVIALGQKAKRRTKLSGRSADQVVVAAGLPGGNSKKAKPSWDAAGEAFQEHLQRRAGWDQSGANP